MARRFCGFVPSCLVILVLVRFGVPALYAETIQGCSTINARVLDGPLDKNEEVAAVVLMRDDGVILASRPVCGGGRSPAGMIYDDSYDEHSDGLFSFRDCGPNGAIATTYLSSDGQSVLTVPTANAGNFSEGLAPIGDARGLWGFMDRTGKTVIDPQYDDVTRFSEGLAAVAVKDQWEFINKTGAVVIRLPQSNHHRVESVEPFQAGLAHIGYSRSRGPWSFVFIDHSGKVVLRGPGDFHDGLAPIRSHGKIGFVDVTGKRVIPPRFIGVSFLAFQEGLAAVFVREGTSAKAGFVDRQGRWVIPPQYDDARHFCGGVAAVKVGKLWGYVNPANQLVVAPKFEDAESFNYGMGAVLERSGDGTLHQEWVNREGRVLSRDPREMKIIEIDDSSILRKRCFLFFRCHI